MDAPDRHGSRYIAVLAVAAGVILVAGWLMRPRDIPQSPPPVPSETELQELARRTERRTLQDMTAYFADVATDVAASLAYVPSASASAVIWDQAHMVTGPMPIAPFSTTVVVRTAGGDRRAETLTSRRLPVSTLTLATDASTRVARRGGSMPKSGDWIVAVWQVDGAPAFAPTQFRQTVTTLCGGTEVHERVSNLTLSHAMIGGGLFTMDRDLLGVILPCSDHVAAIEPASVDALLKHAGTIEERVLTRYGALFEMVSQEERRYFQDIDGLLVREVWNATSADVAGIQAGDILVALDDRAVRSPDDLRPLTDTAADEVPLRLRRGAKTQTIALHSRPEPDRSSGGDLGLVIDSAGPTHRIEAVQPNGAAARAGVRPGDVLLRINHVEPRTRAQAERALKGSATRPLLLEVARGARRIAIVIPEVASR